MGGVVHEELPRKPGVLVRHQLHGREIHRRAAEGALVPLTLRTLLYPFSLQQYVKAAQRSGVHVVLSPSEGGVILYSCGLALDELTGKPAKHVSDEDEEEITGTLEALDFEDKFLGKIRTVFPKTKEI
jgi:hypothetical protein